MTGIGTAAFADPDATLHLGGEPAARRPRANPEILVEAARVADLARVHPAVGVPDGLELAEGRHELVAEHLRQQLGPLLAVAVLARQRTPERHDEVGRLLDEGPVRREPRRAHEVEIGPGVDAPVAKVAVEGPRVPEAVVEVPEASEVPAEVFGGDGGVLPAGVVVGLARRPGRGGEPGLPDLPETAGPGRVLDEP